MKNGILYILTKEFCSELISLEELDSSSAYIYQM